MYKKPGINLVALSKLLYSVIFWTFMLFSIDNPG